MSKNVAMFVDVANMYYAARGQDVDVDYVALLKHATKGRDLIRAYAYTGLDPENENQRKFIDFLAKHGYKPVVKDIRKFGDGRMKANLDIELVVDLFRLADRMDIAVIVSGDGDFAPAIRALQDKGVRAEVISFKPNTSSDLIAVADEFTDIMKIASISRKEARATLRGMSAPEMPAKEVNPEFGFREASPSVAAAALAALRTGGTSTGAGNGRRSRGTAGRRSVAEEAPAALPGATPVAEATGLESAEEGRRRRRRRGGRGRGRSRSEEATPVGGGGEEIGWEELDDLSQIDGLGDADREVGFEEVDPATLAELGLTPEELEALAATAETLTVDAGPADVGAAAAEEEKPKRRRTTRSRAAGDGEETPAAEEEKPKRRRATRSRATADAEAAPAAEEEKPKRRRASRSRAADAGEETPAEEEKPKRRRSTRSRAAGEGEKAPAADSAAPSEASAAGEPQGIWGRFRSARKTRPTSGPSEAS